ncbi:MAG: DUF523 domain-containing protein [Acidobacteria bacterium]|nr:DUF523 domain-containing protein [Acidobacteriota bacterium]
MERILVSACLLGEPVRYNGGAARVDDPQLARWAAEGRLVACCPEVEGGLGTPRPRAERRALRVVTEQGADVTDQFARGARLARDAARGHGIRIAILKDGSPSCGSRHVSDGTFSERRRPGAGVAAEVLRADGVRVFSESEIADAAAFLAVLEARP